MGGLERTGVLPFCPLLEGDEGGAMARMMARVGAYADELRLMGVRREELPVDLSLAS